MKILIIGGTRFVGRHLMSAANTRGHEVTVFHRGSNPVGPGRDVEDILGDRSTDLNRLNGRKWDAVIDTCGYLPQHVDASASALHQTAGSYVFISSISAYAGFSEPDFDEDAPLAKLTPEQQSAFAGIDPRSELNAYALGDLYGALKVLCEEAVEKMFPGRALIIRPGLIVGEFDWTDRFTYWVIRLARGGNVLAPGDPDAFVQFIDGKDLADWIVRMIETGETGIFNATGAPFKLTFGKMLNEIKSVTGSTAGITWISDRFMQENSIAPWKDMPVYLPDTSNTKGFSSANIDLALAKGLRFRDLKETIQDTLEWRKSTKGELKAGLSAARESELFRILNEQSGV